MQYSVDEITIKPYMMNLLLKRLETIAKEMTNITLKSARSGIMTTARDFSCSILTADGRILFISDGIPAHMANMDYCVQSLLELFGDDIHEGDAFLNNSPYHGNTHQADYTYITPVFYDGELMFFVLNRGHQADVGNHIPTTYYLEPKDLYEEGAINWPNVRIHKNYKEIDDLIRMAKMRIRVPNQWYGDYLAQMGSCRVAEQRLHELCEMYGKDYIKRFIEEYMNYGEASILSEIKKLPKAHLEYETTHDPTPYIDDKEAAENGIPVRMKMNIDPDEGYVYIDVTDNRPSVKGGLNMSKATTRANTMQGILSMVDPNIPHNDGTFKRLKIKMGKNLVVGESEHPISMSSSTTNIADRVASMSGAILSNLGPDKGIGEHGYAATYAKAVISGIDPRRGGEAYVNQMILDSPGGGALYGYDGWLTFGSPCSGGVLSLDSVEINEQKYPILIKSRRILKDSQGFGRWCGAPGKEIELIQRFEKGSWYARGDGQLNPPKGVHGGGSSAKSHMYINEIKNISEMWELGTQLDIPQFGQLILEPEIQVLVCKGNGGGGFDDPLDRDPEKVLWDFKEEWISMNAAKDVFGVVITKDAEVYQVDYEATKVLRDQLRNS